MPERVLVAMSGGVDSAVACARLVDEGYDVVGVTFHLWDYPDEAPEKSRCCAPEDAHDARLVADQLEVPHYTFDRRELFEAEVVRPFVDAYLDGQTPSPCIWCNRSVKMRQLFPLADRLGARFVATGHYARILPDGAGKARLHMARDRRKDQSYFLHMLHHEELARVVLPLGDSDKDELRREALERGLVGADKGESQELCFVAGQGYGAFVERHADDGRLRPGPIVDGAGRTVGQHEGIHRFTVGQRRGLGVALGTPAYVTDIASDGRVTVGGRAEAQAVGAEVVDGVWCDDVTFPRRAEVKVRSHHRPVPARLEEGGRRVIFDSPVLAVAPGQLAVAYDGERVLGGGTIVRRVEADRVGASA